MWKDINKDLFTRGHQNSVTGEVCTIIFLRDSGAHGKSECRCLTSNSVGSRYLAGGFRDYKGRGPKQPKSFPNSKDWSKYRHIFKDIFWSLGFPESRKTRWIRLVLFGGITLTFFIFFISNSTVGPSAPGVVHPILHGCFVEWLCFINLQSTCFWLIYVTPPLPYTGGVQSRYVYFYLFFQSAFLRNENTLHTCYARYNS